MTGVLLIVVCALTVAACVTDWRTLRIPNTLCAMIAVLFAVAFLFTPDDFGPWWMHVGAGGLMLVLTFAMFAAGHFGAGDAKLASALALWLGLTGIVPLVLFMGIAGGGLALLALYIKKKKPVAHPLPESWIAQLQGGRNAVPYGIAISVGFWVAVFHTPVTAQHLHELINLIH